MDKIMNTYKLVSELLLNQPHPNIDMLIVKPSLYYYEKNENVDNVMTNGIVVPDKKIKTFFVRISEKNKSYFSFLKSHTPIKVSISRLNRIKDKIITIKPDNLGGYNDSLNEDDIMEISKKKKYFSDFFRRGKDINSIPAAVIYTQKGIIPSFCFKKLDD